MPSILFGLYIVPLLASVAVGQSTGTCLSSASSGNANYQACCATLGAQDVETIDTVSFRYTCNAYMNDFDTPATVANSAAECARRCINSDDCVASSWESGTSQCYLSPDRPGLATRVDAAYGVGWLALEQTTPFDLDTACQSRVDSEAVRAEAACQSRIDAAVAPLQKRLLQSTGFIEGTYIEADHTDKDINSIPVSQAQTVTVDGETWKVYYFQRGGGGASIDHRNDITTIPECVKWCAQNKARGCVRADFEPAIAQCRLFDRWQNASPIRFPNIHSIVRV